MMRRFPEVTYRSCVEWSEDEATVIKRVAGEETIALLPGRRESFLNECYVMALINEVSLDVRVPRLVSVDVNSQALVLEAIPGELIGPKRPTSLHPRDVEDAILAAQTIGRSQPLTRDLFRLPAADHLKHHYTQGNVRPEQKATIHRALTAHRIRWVFAHGDFTARNLIREPSGRLAVIDWERAGIYPAGYDLAFLWYTTGNVPDARRLIEAAVPVEDRTAFWFSALLVTLLHLDRAIHTRRDEEAESEQRLAGWLIAQLGAGAVEGSPDA